jgi:hypothetical protein
MIEDIESSKLSADNVSQLTGDSSNSERTARNFQFNALKDNIVYKYMQCQNILQVSELYIQHTKNLE